MESRLQIEAPRHFGRLDFTVGFLLQMCAVMVPLVMLVIALIITVALRMPPVYATIFIVLEYAAMVVLFLMFQPTLQVNPYIQTVIERTLGLKQPKSVVYDCQITFSPRFCRGLRKLLDDADDVGRLEITNEAVNFQGGCITLTLPYSDLESMTKMRPKARSLWINGGAVRLATSAFDGITHIDFSERQSRTAWTSRWISAEIRNAIEHGIHRNRATTETVNVALP